jgi:hypothetical protein
MAGTYFKKAKTRATGCSYPKTLNMNPSFVVKVSPSSAIQLSTFVLMHRDKLDHSVKKTYCTIVRKPDTVKLKDMPSERYGLLDG